MLIAPSLRGLESGLSDPLDKIPNRPYGQQDRSDINSHIFWLLRCATAHCCRFFLEKPLFENIDTKRVSEGANYYMGAGWKILSLHSVNEEGNCSCGKPNCTEVGKHPATPNGQNDATTDTTVIPTWWPPAQPRNVGAAAKPSGFFVIDIDPRNGGDTSFEKLEENLNYPFVPTVEAITGTYLVNGREVRGRHLYLAYDSDIPLISKFNKKHKLPGIDIKHNGYIVLPPSRHASGVTYEWKHGHAPWEMDMAQPPTELLEMIQKSGSSASPKLALPSGELMETIANARTTTPYGAAALAAELRELSLAKSGTRNESVYNSGRHVAELIAGDQLEGIPSVEALRNVARDLGLSDEEVANILDRSGGALEVGVQNPRTPKNSWDSFISYSEGEPSETEISVLSQANILDWDALFTEEPEPEDWFVRGIICSGRGHSLYSDAGLGKSLLMREISACLASGKETLGFPAREPIKVLYLDYENNPQNDIKSSLIDMGFEASELGNLKVASFPDFAFFDTPKGATQFITLMDEIEPDLIIIDTVSRVVEGDENANDTWNKFYKLTGLHIKKRGIAYVRLDHEGKNAGAGARGGSAKRGDVDIVWHYTKKNGRFRLTCEKSRGPIDNDWVDVERYTSPLLGHRVVGVSGTGGHLDWASMLAAYEKYEKANSVIDLMKTEHGRALGQDKAWSYYREKCTELGVTRKALWDALKADSDASDEGRESEMSGFPNE